MAVIEFHVSTGLFDCLYIPYNLAFDAKMQDIGIGDICYTIGLFRLLAGKKRNLPIVHTGNIALLPTDDKIPVEDWDDPTRKKRRYIDAYLIESQSLDGLSGAPVFVRPTIVSSFMRNDSAGILGTKFPMANIFLIGVWHGAWTAPPDEVMSAEIEKGKQVRISMGMGVVVPITKLIDLLGTSEMRKRRSDIFAKRESNINAVEPDMAIPPLKC